MMFTMSYTLWHMYQNIPWLQIVDEGKNETAHILFKNYKNDSESWLRCKMNLV